MLLKSLLRGGVFLLCVEENLGEAGTWRLFVGSGAAIVLKGFDPLAPFLESQGQVQSSLKFFWSDRKRFVVFGNRGVAIAKAFECLATGIMGLPTRWIDLFGAFEFFDLASEIFLREKHTPLVGKGAAERRVQPFRLAKLSDGCIVIIVLFVQSPETGVGKGGSRVQLSCEYILFFGFVVLAHLVVGVTETEMTDRAVGL